MASKKVIGALVTSGAISLVTISACGASSGTSATTRPAVPVTQSAASAANPVTLVKRAGFETSDVLGGLDAYGARNSAGYAYDSAQDRAAGAGEELFCWTYPDSATQRLDASEPDLQPADGVTIIKGSLWACGVAGVSGATGGTAYYVSPATVAKRLGGTVVRVS